jgi:hypothetical protein
MKMRNSTDTLKECRKCLRHLPITDFRFTDKERDRRHTICKSCRNIHRKVTRQGHIDFDKMLSEQNECCAICGIHYLESKNKFRIDHNHETLQIRGLLCQYCNSGLGFFKDSPTRLAMAIEYLVKNDGITS